MPLDALPYVNMASCYGSVHPSTVAAIVKVESSGNPFSIGVVGGRLERQPKNLAEAVATANALEQKGYNFSVGLGQINRRNLPKYNLTISSAFDPCSNIRAAAGILTDCHQRALKSLFLTPQDALWPALSCYYSGNFKTGFVKEAAFKHTSYVERVAQAAEANPPAALPIPVIPDGSKAKAVNSGAAKSQPLAPTPMAPRAAIVLNDEEPDEEASRAIVFPERAVR